MPWRWNWVRGWNIWGFFLRGPRTGMRPKFTRRDLFWLLLVVILLANLWKAQRDTEQARGMWREAAFRNHSVVPLPENLHPPAE
jgi:hypothetical protein